MNDQPEQPTGDSVPSPRRPDSQDWSSAAPAPAEHTRPLPPYQQPAPERATAPARRGVVTAGVLIGALLVGGAAGVGGAAWYDAWQGDGNSSVSASSPASGGGVTASNSVAKAGTVENVAAKVLPSVVKINVVGQNEAGSGSGIILKSDGTILTNNHVAQVAGNGGSITVNFNDGSTHRAKIIGTDPVTDIAVIRAENVSRLTPATIGHSGELKVGQPVVAVGSPFGLNATVTSGIVSALHRPVSVATSEQPQQPDPFNPFREQPQQPQQQGSDTSTTYPAIQTDAAINPGNSGGPLVDLAGQVVGIDSAIRTSGSSGDTAGGSIGLGFAIPIDEVMPIINQIIGHETPTHARLGITVSDLTGKELQQGAKIHSVAPNGMAAGAGLKPDDVITKVDDRVIDGADALVATIRAHRPGDTVKLTYVRGSSTKTVSVKLGSDEATKSS